jgi:cation:H+ antiporter
VLTDLLLLGVGLLLLVAGGDGVVRGASALAYRCGVSPLIVGLTVVAFGTSAPELAVNIAAALGDRAEISFGNVLGSNIANIGLALGAMALLRPVAIQRPVIVREIPMMSLSTVAALVLASDAWLTDARGAGGFSRADGLMLLLFFVIFLYYTTNDALRQRESVSTQQPDASAISIPRALLYFLLGLGGLVLGGDVTVGSASALALELGISQTLIGLTVVAVGTSLPEIVTSVMAVLRGADAIAVGNVVGSNIFNVLFVLGTSATLRAVPVPAFGTWDLLVALAFALVLLPLSFNPQRHIGRVGGLLLLGAYAAYIAWRVGLESATPPSSG